MSIAVYEESVSSNPWPVNLYTLTDNQIHGITKLSYGAISDLRYLNAILAGKA